MGFGIGIENDDAKSVFGGGRQHHGMEFVPELSDFIRETIPALIRKAFDAGPVSAQRRGERARLAIAIDDGDSLALHARHRRQRAHLPQALGRG